MNGRSSAVGSAGLAGKMNLRFTIFRFTLLWDKG